MSLDQDINLEGDVIGRRQRAFDLYRVRCSDNGHPNAECYEQKDGVKFMYCGGCSSAYRISTENEEVI